MKSNRRFIYLLLCLMFVGSLSTTTTFATDPEPIDNDVIIDDRGFCPDTVAVDLDNVVFLEDDIIIPTTSIPQAVSKKA